MSTRTDVRQARRRGARLSLRRQEGQSLVEFALMVVVVMLVLTGMLEFGFLFDEHMTLETATREGARVGSALGNGGAPLGCGSGQSPNAALVDPQIIAAVQRVISSPGSRVDPSRISQIKIYRVKLTTSGVTDVTGDQAGPDGTNANIWVPDVGNGPSVDGANLDFRATSTGWNACSRFNGFPADSIGVSLTYTYRMVTPLPSILSFFAGGSSNILINDRSVMAMNPT